MKTATLKNEEGTRMVAGVLCKMSPGDENLYRTVTFFSEVVWGLDDQLMRPTDRLRGNEPEETFSQLNKATAAEHPAVPAKSTTMH